MHITRSLSVCPLLDITDAEFEQQYSNGVWWAMYGDEQGKGLYADDYLISNVTRNLKAGKYNNPSSSWLPTSGFYFGMLHGGWLIHKPDTLVVLTDTQFTKGYYDGRKCCDRLTDKEIIMLLHMWAHNRGGDQVLSYLLGKVTGTLSHALSLATIPVTSL